jgi:hypothetical protein
MSRGPGRIRRMICDLIAGDAHGAWTVTDLCERIYPDDPVEKWHRVAVTRALRGMVLPSTWRVRRMQRQGGEYCVYDECDLESTLRFDHLQSPWRGRSDFPTWKQQYPRCIEEAERKVREACRYRDASPVGKLDIEIARARHHEGFLKMMEASPAAFDENRQRIAALIERKAELERACPPPPT